MGKWLDVTAADKLHQGGREFIDVGEHRIMVFNLEGEFYAIENLCTHAYFELDEAPVKDGAIQCPLHGAEFCIKTGAVLTPPAFEDLLTFPVRVNDGMIQVEVAE